MNEIMSVEWRLRSKVNCGKKLPRRPSAELIRSTGRWWCEKKNGKTQEIDVRMKFDGFWHWFWLTRSFDSLDSIRKLIFFFFFYTRLTILRLIGIVCIIVGQPSEILEDLMDQNAWELISHFDKEENKQIGTLVSLYSTSHNHRLSIIIIIWYYRYL